MKRVVQDVERNYLSANALSLAAVMANAPVAYLYVAGAVSAPVAAFAAVAATPGFYFTLNSPPCQASNALLQYIIRSLSMRIELYSEKMLDIDGAIREGFTIVPLTDACNAMLGRLAMTVLASSVMFAAFGMFFATVIFRLLGGEALT